MYLYLSPLHQNSANFKQKTKIKTSVNVTGKSQYCTYVSTGKIARVKSSSRPELRSFAVRFTFGLELYNVRLD